MEPVQYHSARGRPPARFRQKPKSKPIRADRVSRHESKSMTQKCEVRQNSRVRNRATNTHDKVVRFCFRMKWVPALSVLLLAASPSATQSAQTASKSSAKSSSHSASAGAAHKRSTKRSRSRAAPKPSYQTHPDPERYQEIQKALADRGYFRGEVNGTWGDDSTDALKRFQADQKLPDDGKINALTLIGLGLGPKHDTGTTPPLAVAPSSNAPVAAPPAAEPLSSSSPPPSQAPTAPPQ